MERLFVLKTLSRVQRAMKVKKFVGISLKRLRSRVMPRNMRQGFALQCFSCLLTPRRACAARVTVRGAEIMPGIIRE